MTNSENFDEVETVDAEFEEETPAAPVKPVKKSGGAGKFIVLLAVLGIGGALGGEYMGLIKLPVDIPGVTPAKTAAIPAATPVTDTAAIPPASPADLTGGLPPATGADAVPPAPPAAVETAAAPAITAPAMIPGAVGSKLAPDGTTIKSPGDKDPFADLPPATPLEETAAAKPATEPPPGITAPAGIAAPVGITAPPGIGAPDAAAPADALATTPAPATDVTAAVSGTDPMATPAADPLGAAPAPAPAADPIVSADPAPAAADPAIEGKIESLQSQVTTLEQNAANLKAAADAKDAEIAKLQADLAAAKAGKAASVSASASTGDEPVAAAPKKKRVRAVPSSAAPVVSAKVTSRWVLKSAKPGMAWVAPPGSNELKSIAVGDTLNGVGRITAIAKDGTGRWYVSGTRGRIQQ